MIRTSEIDANLRPKLAESVRQLVAGELTSDEFDDVYDECCASPDRAVREIASRCWGLYSSCAGSYRLKGWYRVGAETQAWAERARVFLGTGLVYDWPPAPDDPGYRSLAGAALSLGIPGSIALGLIGAMLLSDDDTGLGVLLTAAAIFLLLVSIVVLKRRPRSFVKKWEAYQASGDFDAWPFLKREDWEVARKFEQLPKLG